MLSISCPCCTLDVDGRPRCWLGSRLHDQALHLSSCISSHPTSFESPPPPTLLGVCLRVGCGCRPDGTSPSSPFPPTLLGVCLGGGVSARWARPCSRNRVVDNVQHDDDDDDASAMASSTLHNLNPNAERMGPQASLHMNLQAAKGLEDVLRTNLGPKGTVKMLVGGAGGA